MARTLWRNHCNIEIGARLDLLIMNIETVRKRQRRTQLDIRRDDIAIQAGLVFVDARADNVEAPAACGMRALAFTDAATLRADLRALGLPV